ncbi:MAG: glycoside hydrolase family 5 protein [Proteobacteria bacterium]|nr:glycoside hydrolase family 5 protein [Pseudomonadota bacterium]
MRATSALFTSLLAVASLVVQGACVPPESEPELPPPGGLGPLSVSDDLRIVDDRDREVLLRGANITSLGEYWQGNADLPPTVALTEQDWDDMEARGFSVIRLVVHWSLIEPERGQIDDGYLDEIEAVVEDASEHGIYTVIDMHQDAWSAFIFTSEEEACPPDSWPGKGWDGAPEWACITDGASTCVVGDRNSAPAVVNAWNHFYDNTDGIRDRFVASWAAVGERFADRPEVAGYDLLNEADASRPADELAPIYNELLGELVTALRGVGADQLIFIEPAIPAGDRDFGLVFPNPESMGVEPHNLVGSTHNYAESIDTTGLSIEATNDFIWAMAQQQGTGVWIGEYGFWGTSPETLDKAARYGADEDAHVQGGAWWQWRQPCGDPHSLHRVEGGWEPGDTIVHLNSMDCVEGVDLGPTEEFFSILSRAYPRAAPGRITSLQSDPVTGAMRLDAVAGSAGETLEVWTPTQADSHRAIGEGLDEIEEQELGGGRRLTVTVPDRGPYSLSVEPI